MTDLPIADEHAEQPEPGTVVHTTTVVPSAAARRTDARGRLGNTATQATVAGAIVIIGGWAAALGHVDLDPYGPGSDMPQSVAGAFGIILTVIVAWWMNRSGLRAVDEE